jgi:2-polyprenyl-3-methyl-5-hydroxy-6-metoxy-1,4-benzoquinol methylase
MEAEFWDERYSQEHYAYGKEPNDFFRETIDSMIAGKILIPAAGEGRDVIFAAQKGWMVDAFDISKAGLNKAMKLAREKGVKINYEIDNILFFQPKMDFYNLAAVIFLHLPRQQRRILSTKLWDSLRPGGKIIMEVFSKNQADYGTGGPKDLNLLYSEDDILSDFPCFKPELLQTMERNISEGTLHKGKASVIRFIGVK